MLEFWHLIVQSNTFNFIILLVILVMIYQKLDLTTKIEKMAADISDFIENSKREKAEASHQLQLAEKSVENLDNEIETVIAQAKVSAQNVFDEIQEMAKKSVEKIEANVEKIIDNETRKISSRLSGETVDNAIKIAEQKLKDMFAKNPELHEEYINESINFLDRIKL